MADAVLCCRERHEREELAHRAQEEYERQKEAEARLTMEQQWQTEQRRRQVLAKLSHIQTRKVADNLKVTALLHMFNVD